MIGSTTNIPACGNFDDGVCWGGSITPDSTPLAVWPERTLLVKQMRCCVQTQTEDEIIPFFPSFFFGVTELLYFLSFVMCHRQRWEVTRCKYLVAVLK